MCALKDEILMKIAELSVLHVNSLNPLVKACYHEVFLLCPWTHSLKFLMNTEKFQCNSTKVIREVYFVGLIVMYLLFRWCRVCQKFTKTVKTLGT